MVGYGDGGATMTTGTDGSGSRTDPDLGRVHVRPLRASEAVRLGDAIRSAYGDTYDSPWVYDAHEVARRIAEGLLVSAIAETDDGTLLCHAAMSFRRPHDPVGHVGQAVTLPEARGHHLFVSVKRHLVYLAKKRGLAGLYSEATAAHPYSQRANVELGAQETGFLLGWIPATVDNNAAGGPEAEARRRQSAALFYLRTSFKPARPVFASARHRQMTHEIIAACRLHARLADPPRRARLERHSALHSQVHADHNVAVLTVTKPGADLAGAVAALRRRHFERGVDAVYVDLPLELHQSALAAEDLEDLGVSFAGIFPNTRDHGDVLRLQSLNGVVVSAADVVVASDHGRRLLDYVLADLAATGHNVEGFAPPPDAPD